MSIELLAPAGNFAKLKTAFYFGADAVYVGGKDFSLRSFADNFTRDELVSAVKYAHALGKKIYVTANVFAKNTDLRLMEDYFGFLGEAGADAVIVSDSGVFYAVRKSAPKLSVHISTQANLTNKYAVRFWKEQGAERAILARELSLGEIAEIHSFVPDIELEAFVHGAMCISYSGRCLLSDYLASRPSNRGECVQACRWNYTLKSGDRDPLTVEEDERGTYVLNSKDLNMSAHLDKMRKAGVCSFKIEGRMKSEYYLATVINAYRRCIDGGFNKTVEEELLTAAHRRLYYRVRVRRKSSDRKLFGQSDKGRLRLYRKRAVFLGRIRGSGNAHKVFRRSTDSKYYRLTAISGKASLWKRRLSLTEKRFPTASLFRRGIK